MTSFLRLLEEWSTHQDYVWFLALLAWGGVIAAEIRRGENHRIVLGHGWLVALAAAAIGGALAELLLLAQRLLTPYVFFDAAMGAATAAGTAALAWHACAGRPRAASLRRLAIAACVALAGARILFPVTAGYGLAIAQALALWAIVRRRPGSLPAVVALALALAPILATHGPWASALGHGRKTTDWSHFALAAALTSLLAGGWLVALAWRRRLHESVPEFARGTALHRDLRRATAWLAAWLIAGVLLAVWYGRVARRSFEENLLRRAETCVAALEPRLLNEALVPELQITSIRREFYSDGRPINVATVPYSAQPKYGELRAQLVRLRERNPDATGLFIAIPRQGHLLVLSSVARTTPGIRHVARSLGELPDDETLRHRPHLHGPTHDEHIGSRVSARVPLFHSQTQALLGWLTLEIEAAHWMATFVQARLQTMVLVAAGVGLWIVAVAYRLRREARDAAERKATEAAAADRMKSAFLAKVSHELRTPIQSVLGYGELLGSAPLAEPHRSFLTALRSHGDLMLRLVNDLIDLGALQSGAFRLEVAPVNLPALVADCASAVRPAVVEKRLDFAVTLAPDLPAWVRTDGVRLRQVLLNLLNNAVKFTRKGGVTLTVRSRENAVEFSIADTGPGIPAAQRSRLFQPFARLDPAAGGGSGLGLALVQGMCGAMGGEVRLAETSPGCTFVVQLPLGSCAAPPREVPAPETGVSLGGLRVVLAEDNTLVRDLLGAFLHGQGVLTSVALDGPTAIALTREQRPDVLLLDIALPGLDGIAVAQELRRAGPAGLRIIGLSAHATLEDERRARAAGMHEFLAKPVSLAELARVLAQNARRSGPSPEPTAGLPAALRAQLASQFVAETPLVLDALRAALANQDWPRLRDRAHYLKNSADIIGAADLQSACRKLSALADAEAAHGATSLVAEVESAVAARILNLAETLPADRN